MRVRYPSSPCPPARLADPRGRGERLRAAALLLALVAAPLGAATLGAAPARAQAAYQPEFDVDVVAFRADDAPAPRLDIYTAIPYTNLRFLARPGGFEARYAVNVEVHRLDDRGRRAGLAYNRSWEREVQVADYAGTQADSLVDRATEALAVEPGRYAVEVQVQDAASGRAFVRETALRVNRFDGDVAVSDLLLLDRYDADARAFAPNVGAAVRTDQEAFTVFYEIYAEAPTEVEVSYVVTEQNRVRDRPSFRALLGLAPREQADLGTPLVLTERLSVPAGRTPATLRVPTERFRVGDYVLGLRVETVGGELVAESEKAFAVRWMGLEGQITNLEDAVAQLRYVAKDREIRAIRNAADPEERLRLFRAFWDRRDPTPGTRRNERMEEYYYRVAYANERYSRMRDAGWNTDRGEVYIRFGDPDFVEQHPFNYGTKPYEIWYYNGYGRRFVFVDETGGGDYRLLVPIWDERTRM